MLIRRSVILNARTSRCHVVVATPRPGPASSSQQARVRDVQEAHHHRRQQRLVTNRAGSGQPLALRNSHTRTTASTHIAAEASHCPASPLEQSSFRAASEKQAFAAGTTYILCSMSAISASAAVGSCTGRRLPRGMGAVSAQLRAPLAALPRGALAASFGRSPALSGIAPGGLQRPPRVATVRLSASSSGNGDKAADTFAITTPLYYVSAGAVFFNRRHVLDLSGSPSMYILARSCQSP